MCWPLESLLLFVQEASCAIEGTCYSDGNDKNRCLTCDVTKNTTGWSLKVSQVLYVFIFYKKPYHSPTLFPVVGTVRKFHLWWSIDTSGT